MTEIMTDVKVAVSTTELKERLEAVKLEEAIAAVRFFRSISEPLVKPLINTSSYGIVARPNVAAGPRAHITTHQPLPSLYLSLFL